MIEYDEAMQRKITAAIGFCELGMWESAWDELETLEPEERVRPDVLAIRLGNFIALEKYESAALLAEGMIARGEDSPHTWLQGAIAIRWHRSIEEARAFLLRAETRLESNATFHYTLATFECRLGSMAKRPGASKNFFWKPSVDCSRAGIPRRLSNGQLTFGGRRPQAA